MWHDNLELELEGSVVLVYLTTGLNEYTYILIMDTYILVGLIPE